MKKLILAVFVFILFSSTAHAVSIKFIGFQAQMSTTINPLTGNVEMVSLLVDISNFGVGGVAGGMTEVGQGPPDDSIWMAGTSRIDPFLPPPLMTGYPPSLFSLILPVKLWALNPSHSEATLLTYS